jgi:hypothetical protein
MQYDNHSKITPKIIVFDLDETLGYFTQFGILWSSLKEYNNSYGNIILEQELFNNLLDLYPEFIRPNIINILIYLKEQKQDNNCKKLLIYTNNQGPKEWSIYIKNYFEDKIKYTLFDQIIGAFKINGEKIELCRTTNNKTKFDLIRCSEIDEHSKICFIDDVYYPDMTDNNIYYINLKPYIYDLPFEVIINRFSSNKIINIVNTNYLLNIMNRYNYIYIKKNKLEYNVDKTISKKLLELLKNFFNDFKIHDNIIKKSIINKSKKKRVRTINKSKKLRT